jgi:hypothetical protein
MAESAHSFKTVDTASSRTKLTTFHNGPELFCSPFQFTCSVKLQIGRLRTRARTTRSLDWSRCLADRMFLSWSRCLTARSIWLAGVEEDRRQPYSDTQFGCVPQKNSSCGSIDKVVLHLSYLLIRRPLGWVVMTMKLVSFSSPTVMPVPTRPRTGKSTTAPMIPPNHPPSRSAA